MVFNCRTHLIMLLTRIQYYLQTCVYLIHLLCLIKVQSKKILLLWKERKRNKMG